MEIHFQVWTKRLTTRLVIAQLFLSAVQCGQIFFCDYSFVEKNGVKYVSYFDDSCTVVNQSDQSYEVNIILVWKIEIVSDLSHFRYSLDDFNCAHKSRNVSIVLDDRGKPIQIKSDYVKWQIWQFIKWQILGQDKASFTQEAERDVHCCIRVLDYSPR